VIGRLPYWPLVPTRVSTPVVAHRRRRFLVGLGVVAIVAAALPAAVAAHLPTQGKREYAPDNHHQMYEFGTRVVAPPSWLQMNVNNALNGDWDSANTTRSPYFSLLSGPGEIATIYWATNAETPNTDECPIDMWAACTDYRTNGQVEDRWKSTTFSRDNPSGALNSWFCELDPANGCYDTRRVTLHEAGHAAGMSRVTSNGHEHFPGGAATNPDHSVMHNPPIPKASPGYNQRWLGTCDVLSLAIDYDLDDFAGVYPGCADHLGAPAAQNADIDTTVTQSTTTLTLCVNQSFSFTGTARIVTAAILGELSGNGLAGRTVSIYRRTPSGTFAAYTTTTVAGGEGGAWSRAISNVSAATYIFQARYTPNATDDPTLDGDSSAVEKTVTWVVC
jgi:hypothetical protein